MIPYSACYNTATIAIVPAIIIASSSDSVTDTNAHAGTIITTPHWEKPVAVLLSERICLDRVVWSTFFWGCLESHMPLVLFCVAGLWLWFHFRLAASMIISFNLDAIFKSRFYMCDFLFDLS